MRRLALAALALAAFAASPAAAPIELAVDAREAARHLLHVRETIPVAPGTVALTYPKWIPGEHAPTGLMIEVAGLRIECGGTALAWRRDDTDAHLVRCAVPKGADRITVAFDFLLSTDASGYSSSATATEHMVLIAWNQVLFAPAGARSDATPVRAALELPAGWEIGTPLPVESRAGSHVQFGTVSLTTLVDSPVLAGDHLRHLDLSSEGAPPAWIDVACDGEAGHAFDDSLAARGRRLMREAAALFGGAHYRQYRFLLALSDHVAEYGLEHHECSDNRQAERAWVDESLRCNGASLLPHELAHSWNGKYRRPAGLATPNYEQPMKTELLWAYEGLTTYLGWVLACRSGFRTTEEGLGVLALDAATLDYTRGREWRPLVDTAIHAGALYDVRGEWGSWRRSTDFYSEGMLVWLEADAMIRGLTQDRKSLDDFCRAFFAGRGAPEVKPYVAADVYAALGAIAPYDWAGFFRARLEALQPHAPLGGLQRCGWELAWGDTGTAAFDSRQANDKSLDERFSIGVVFAAEGGAVRDVIPGSAADQAGIAPDMKLVGVNGRRWNSPVLHDAIRATARGEPLELLLENGEFLRTFRLEYRGGLRYPHLVRNAEPADRLADILAPHSGR